MDHYGLFPRAALEIYHALKNSGKKYILTCNISEDKWFNPICMMTKKPIKIDPEQQKYIGQLELIIESPADLVKFFKKVESERNVAAHAMNSTSSRSNAIMELKCYTKSGANVTVNYFKVLDLAGSERQKKAKAEGNFKKVLNVDAVLNNV